MELQIFMVSHLFVMCENNANGENRQL